MAYKFMEENRLLFNPIIAKSIGLNEAIVLNQIHYWCKLNEKSHTNMRDGYHWSYNSAVKWQEQFPFWSVSTVRRSLTNLEYIGYLVVGNYNKNNYDRTKWYRVDYELINATLSFAQIEQMEHANMSKAIPKIKKKLTRKEEELQEDTSLTHDVTHFRNNSEVHKFMNIYMNDFYKQRYKINHPALSKEQWNKVYDHIYKYTKYNDIDCSTLCDMAVEFFDNVKTSNWNINHFATDGVLNILGMRIGIGEYDY